LALDDADENAEFNDADMLCAERSSALSVVVTDERSLDIPAPVVAVMVDVGA